MKDLQHRDKIVKKLDQIESKDSLKIDDLKKIEGQKTNELYEVRIIAAKAHYRILSKYDRDKKEIILLHIFKKVRKDISKEINTALKRLKELNRNT